MKMPVLTIVLLSAALLQTNAQAQSSCAPSNGYGYICGPENAEDLVAVPGTRWVIASAMRPGTGLYLIDSRSKDWSVVYPGDVALARQDMSTYGNCPGSPDPNTLITHGLNLRPGRNGHSTLYAVSHGAREAIEVFDVDADGNRPTLTWIGCVEMPHGLEANSVASFEDGTLVATVLLHPGTYFEESFVGTPTGAVYLWSPDNPRFTKMRGTELPTNNGIEVSSDQREIFVASSGLSTIVAFSRENPSRQLRTTERLPFTPDNVHMAPDGRLITAGMLNDVPECGGDPISGDLDLAELGACPRGFMAVAIDPATMQVAEFAEGVRNPAFSNATMALQVGDEVWVGTFSGDRIGYVPLD
ncbi:MAG: hypothetical protein PVF63_08225 [Gammaproteobacteria bacterium]|jgi:hypothetical protein